jgi:hypothetical protein
MYPLLLLLGTVITAAGLAFAASGLSIQNHSFDAASVTPGIIAVIGGCILIGLAFVVRALLRVERALNMRAMLRQPAGAAAHGTEAASAAEPARIPFPAKPKPATQPAAVAAAAAARLTAAEAQPATGAPEQIPPPERLESTPIAGETVSLSSTASNRPDEDPENNHGVAVKANGAGNTANVVRVASGGRASRRPQPLHNTPFDALWPKARTAASAAQAGAAAQAAPQPQPQPAEDPEASGQRTAPALAAAPASQAAPVALSILKSGVVEGMAYTLYSDGSIEAELPGGTVRFRSIAELRNHIEQKG